VGQQRLLRLDLPVAQGRGHRLAAEVHERGRLEQPQPVSGDVDLRRLAEELGLDAEAYARPVGERVDEAEPGVVPGPRVFRPGVAQADDESQSFHRDVPAPPGETGRGCGGRWTRRAAARGRAPLAERDDLLGGDHFSSPAGASPSSAASSSAAASTRPCLAMTTASSWSLPSLSCWISTPWGSLRLDR